MKNKTKQILFILSAFLLVPSLVRAEIIFQDDFDDCTQNCSSAQSTAPSGWGSWYQWGGYQATVGGVTHYSGEISSPGRGGSGKSLKIWRAGQYWDNYTGALMYYFPGSHSELYMRYYVKLPTALDLSTTTSQTVKLWRLRPSGSIDEIYLNINQFGGSLRNTGELQVATSNSTWTTVLNHSDLLDIWDGNWHSWEWHINLNTGFLELWIDGVRKYNSSSFNFGGGYFWQMEHFSLGNHVGGSWQSTWQALDVDDLVMSTTYVGPDGTPSDTTPPTISNPLPSSTLAYGTTSTNMQVTTNENATCKYATTNIAYASMPNTFTTTGSTSHSQTLSGLTNGSSTTYYVRCMDSSSNANTTSTTINVTVSNTAPIVNGACGSANNQAYTSLTSSSPNLCATGTVSSFTGTGPWTWGCVGSGGGTSTSATACSATLTDFVPLFTESFENNNYSDRDWYDNPAHGLLETSGCQAGNCLKWSWASGATQPTNGASMRKLFTPTDSLYVSFYTKFQTGWRGSQQAYHPHMIYIPSDLDSEYTPLANNYLQTYIEFVSDIGSPYAIRPLLAIQDQKRVNTSYGTPPNNLTAVTENRSVSYCNTPVPTGAEGVCYADNPYYSANYWTASNSSLTTNAWHKVEVYLQMNTISGGIGLSNGIMQQWIDGTLVIDHNNILYRTGQDATKKWAQFVLGPWIGDGAPIAQTMWLDELIVGDSLPSASSDSPSAPAGLSVM